jgi:hypothetical protein
MNSTIFVQSETPTGGSCTHTNRSDESCDFEAKTNPLKGVGNRRFSTCTNSVHNSAVQFTPQILTPQMRAGLRKFHGPKGNMFHFGKIQGLTTGLRPIYVRVVALLPAYVIFGGYGKGNDPRSESAEESPSKSFATHMEHVIFNKSGNVTCSTVLLPRGNSSAVLARVIACQVESACHRTGEPGK